MNLASLMARVLPVESGVYLKIDHQDDDHYGHGGIDDIRTIIIIMIKIIIIIF